MTNLRIRLMDLIYTYDPERFHLGSLCKYGHRWPGTERSLRRTHHGPAKAHGCVGCRGRKAMPWLLAFVDYKAMGWPSNQRLGKLCPLEHRWNGLDASLRIHTKCIECEKMRRSSDRYMARRAEWYELNKEDQRRKARERLAERLEDPAYREICRERSRVCIARKRAENGRESRSKYGLPHGYLQQHGFFNGQGSAVAELLSQGLTPEQIHQALLAREEAEKESPPIEVLLERIARRYFQSHEFVRKAQAREKHRRNMQDPEFVLYMRQKSKRRKAILRGSIGVQVKGKQIRARFAEFNHCCAYCGAGGDMQIEHVVPISRGGTHVLSNIVPACQDCNYSKTYKEVEAWYRSQPFFCERRWRKILNVIGVGKGSPNQLALL